MNFYYIPPILILLKSLVTQGEAGAFPSDAWDPALRNDIPEAIAYVETHVPELSLPPPPTDDSQETYSEIDYLKQIAQTRSPRDIVLIAKEDHDPQRRFYDLLDINEAEHPLTIKLVKRTAAEAYLPILYFKQKFSRIRPYQLDNDLSTVINEPPHASYPSGHATQGYLLALVLSDLLEKGDPRVDELMELGTRMGTRREIAGVHYPSDTRAGVELAKQLKDWLMKKPDFQEVFFAAKAELAATHFANSTAH